MQLARRIEEEILLLKIKHGDQEAFAQIYDLYVDALFRFVSFRVPTQEHAQDIVSELFLRLWQRLREPDAKVQNVRAFAYQIARNLIADFYRSAQETLPLEQAYDKPHDTATASPDFNVSLREVEDALRQLRPESQEIIILAHIEGIKPKEIATIIGKTPEATRVMLHRALQELKDILGHE